MSEKEKFFYGGQAVLEGVMMRSKTAYATAVRRLDKSIIIGTRELNTLGQRYAWARWPFIRGNVGMIDSLTMGLESLNFSGNVALEDEAREAEKKRDAALASGDTETADDAAKAAAEAEAQKAKNQQSLGEKALWLTMLPAMAIGIGLFVLLPAWAVDWFMGAEEVAVSAAFGEVVQRNLLEGFLRLLAIIGYILAISLIPYIKRVFQYHGAEHATINTYEHTGGVSVASVLRNSQLDPRCGSAFILVVIVIKIFANVFLGWPALWLRLLLRLLVLAPIAGIAYEIIRLAGKHRGTILEKVLAGPGLAMQLLTTRKPDEDQVEVAIYALATVAPDVNLPEDFEKPEMVKIGRAGQIIREEEPPQTLEAGDEAEEPAAIPGEESTDEPADETSHLA